MNDTLDFYKNDANEWQWRIISSNGEIIGASHEGYISFDDCQANADREQQENDDFGIYKDNANEWRWCVTASNGKIIGASHIGYINRPDCVDNARVNDYFFLF